MNALFTKKYVRSVLNINHLRVLTNVSVRALNLRIPITIIIYMHPMLRFFFLYLYIYDKKYGLLTNIPATS